MAHRLVPKSNAAYLAPETIVERLKLNFDHVDADHDRGSDHVASMIAQFLRMKAPQEILDRHIAAQPPAIHIVVTDDPDSEDSFVQFVAMPDEGLFIGYRSQQHETAAAGALTKCASALDYQIQLV